MFLWLKTLYRKRAVTWPFIFYTIIWTLSCDGFFDSWSSYVSSDLLEKVNNFCQITGKITEVEISQTLNLATRGLSTYNDSKAPWIAVGDVANILFTEVASSAELIARLPQKRTVLLNGHWIEPEYI